MIQENVQIPHDKLQKILSKLAFCCEYDIPSEPGWNEEILNLFSTDVIQAIELLDTIDFNGAAEQHLLSYLPNIVKNMKTAASQALVIEQFKQLQTKFPNVHFEPVIFWSQLHCGFLDGTGKPRSAK